MIFSKVHPVKVIFLISCWFSGGDVLAESQPSLDPPTVVNELLLDEKATELVEMAPAAPSVEVAPLATPSIEWVYHKTVDGKHPSGIEQQQLWLVNRARSNPTTEGQWLATETDSDVAGGRTYFGVDIDLLQDEFAAISVMPPAAFDRRLYEAAYAHSLDLISRDAQDHTGQFDHVDDGDFSYFYVGGVVFSYTRSGLHVHAAFNIDWGYSSYEGDDDGMQEGRGHRVALMSDGMEYTNVGIASVYVTEGGKDVGPYVTTGNYAKAQNIADHSNRFIVGTVWKDVNNNGRYDEGEGFNDVTVMPDKGAYYAITGDAGGYAIPITETGTVTITFSGGDLPAIGSETALLSDESVLLDFVPKVTYFHDADGDGYGNILDSIISSSQPAGYVLDDSDCDDTNPSVNPGAVEVCDNIDNNCNLEIDEGVMPTWYEDLDNDLYGNPLISQEICSQPFGFVADNTDCDDADYYAHPEQIWFSDDDDDGYSNGTTNTESCIRPTGFKASEELTAVVGDEDDEDSSIHPGRAYNLSVSVIGDNGGRVVSSTVGIDCGIFCEAGFPTGSEVILTASSDTGYRFVGWSDTLCGQNTTCTVTISGDTFVTATFRKSFPWSIFLPAILNKRSN